MPHRLARRVYRHMSLFEVVSVLACYWWALSMALDHRQFRVNRGFAAMADLAPQGHWAIFALLAGTAQALVLLIPLPEPYQRAATLVQVAWWSMLSASIAYALPLSPGVGIYAGMAILQCARLRRL